MSKNYKYFSDMALARFIAAQNRTIEKILCHLVLNLIDSNNPLQVIENVQLVFTDKSVLTIALNEEGNGLDAVDFEFDPNNHPIPEEFRQKIKFVSVDASTTTLWKDVIGTNLKAVKLTKDQEYYRNDALVLDFDTEKREIMIGPDDGLIIDYFED